MRTRNRTALKRAVSAAAVAVAAAVAPQAHAMYVGMYAIGDFVPESSGGCGADDVGAWPGMVQSWWDEMGARGHYRGPVSSRFRQVDGNMTIRRFCDPNAYSAECRDAQSSSPHGVDWMDAAIVATHGWDDGDHWGGVMRRPAWNGECALRMGGTSNQVKVGDSWVEFFHASSCNSADDDNLPGIRTAMQDTATSGSRRAHQFDGFHGVMWISSGFNGDYRDTAADGHAVSVAWSWVTNHHKSNSLSCEWYDPFNVFGTCQDQCPIAYAVGSSGADAEFRLLNERYNWRFGDPAGNSNYRYLYYEQCDPVGETAFTPP